MNRSARRILIGVGVGLALLLLLLVLVPVLFAGKISDRVKTQLNRTLLARVDWRSAGLGFFHDFPNLTLTLDDFSIVGVGKFQGDTLAAIPRFRIVVDLPSAIRAGLGGSAPIVVRAIELDRPRLALKALDDTTANWNITRPDTTKAKTAEAGKPMALSLKRFQLADAHITFDNQAARLKAAIVGLSQTLSGDFSQNQVAVATRAHADTATVEFAGITYLNHVRVDLSVDAAADMVKKAVTLKQSGLRLNDLTLALSGSAASVGDDLALDLTFGAPKTDFKSILSLVPAVYAKDFATVKTTGSLALSGNVKGKYGKTAFPAFNLRTKVDNATFRYPDLPLPARDIFLDLGITNPGGSADNTTVNLSRLHLVLGKNPVDATLVLRTPISDPDVDARMQGTVDLADLRRTIKLDNVQQLAGVVSADAAVRTRMSYVDKGQYDRVAARGTVDIRDLSVKSKALPHPLGITQASLVLAPERAQLKSFSGTVGSSDLRASGTLENLLGYVFRDDDLKGSASLASNKFVLDEWRSGEGELTVIPVPPKIDFALDATVKRAPVRQAGDERRPREAPDQGPADHPGELLAQHPGRQHRAHRVLRDQGHHQAHLRHGAQAAEDRHPHGLRPAHHGPDAGAGGEVRRGKLHHRRPDEGRAGTEHDAAAPGGDRRGEPADLQGADPGLPAAGEGGRGHQAQLPERPDPQPDQLGIRHQGGTAPREAVLGGAGGDEDGRVGIQRAGPVAGLRPQAPGSPEPDRRRQRRARRARLEGGSRPRGGADRWRSASRWAATSPALRSAPTSAPRRAR